MSARAYSIPGKKSRVLSMLGLLLAIIIVAGCRDRQATIRLQNARSALQNQLSSVKQTDDGSPVCRILAECLKDALRQLDDLPDNGLSRPILVYALANQKDNRLALEISWVEDGGDVTGFYLSNKSSTTDYPNTLVFDSEQSKVFAGTAWRSWGIPVTMGESDKSWANGRDTRELPPPLLIPIPISDYNKGEIRLGLLTKTGREPATVVVGLQRLSKRSSGGKAGKESDTQVGEHEPTVAE